MTAGVRAVGGSRKASKRVELSGSYKLVSENRRPEYGTLNSRILIIRPPNKVPLIFENSHKLGLQGFRFKVLGFGAVRV